MEKYLNHNSIMCGIYVVKKRLLKYITRYMIVNVGAYPENTINLRSYSNDEVTWTQW
jgi:hypothetical protein